MTPLTTEQIEELNERSKSDSSFIAGSEVRMLCQTALHFRERMVKADADRYQAEAERDRWRAECGPLLDRLTGSPDLCGSPEDYAVELLDELSKLREVLEKERKFHTLVEVIALEGTRYSNIDDLVTDYEAEKARRRG